MDLLPCGVQHTNQREATEAADAAPRHQLIGLGAARSGSAHRDDTYGYVTTTLHGRPFRAAYSAPG
jgi:hypothetical protein